MGTLLQDLRYAARSMRKSPGFTATAVAALVLGIGANTAIFSVINAVLLRPLPYADPGALVAVYENDRTEGDDHDAVAPANFADWREQTTAFAGLAAYRHGQYNFTGEEQPERVLGSETTANYFEVLGVGARLGRTFGSGDGVRGGERVAVLGDRLWRSRFGADPAVVGRTVAIDGEAVTVVGVMGGEFFDPGSSEFWLASNQVLPSYPLNPSLDPATLRQNHYLDVVGRLGPGVTLEQARADMAAVGARLEQQYPDANMGVGASVFSLREEMVGDMRPTLLVLFAAVGFVLLIACANVANLLLARATARRREIAIRAALGAARSRIVRQLLTESVLLSLVGGAIGLLVAMWGVAPLAALGVKSVTGLDSIPVDARVLAFTLAVSALTGLVFGLAPALQASRADVNDVLKDGARGATGGLRRNRVRSALVVSEIALSLVLLIGAALMIESFARLEAVEPGFDPTNVVTMQITLPNAKYPEKAQQAAFYEQTVRAAAAAPGVRSAGAVTRLPLSGGNSSRSIGIVGAPDDMNMPTVDLRIATPGYFGVMGIPVLEGRDLSEHDAAGSERVCVVNEVFAKRYWPDSSPVGRQLKVDDKEPAEIVGVVGNVRHSGLDVEPRPELYLDYLQNPWPFMTVVARTSVEPTSVMTSLRDAVWSVDRNQPVANVATMEQVVAKSVARRRFNTQLLGVFAAVALLLAAVGIYGVMAFTVGQRVHEIGIRMALGARPADIVRLVFGQGMALVAAGVALGIAAALALTRGLEGLLYGVSPTDPATFGAIAALLAAVAAVACYVPARRATRVDPLVALRQD